MTAPVPGSGSGPNPEPAPDPNEDPDFEYDPDPEWLRSQYEDVIRHESTHEVDADSFRTTRERVQRGRGWGVGALVCSDAGILLVHQNDRWYAPGGMLEFGESLVEGAVREVYEETGVEIRIEGLAAIVEGTFSNGNDRFTFYFGLFDGTAETTAVAEDPGMDDEEIQAVEWHPTVPEDTYDHELIADLYTRH